MGDIRGLTGQWLGLRRLGIPPGWIEPIKGVLVAVGILAATLVQTDRLFGAMAIQDTMGAAIVQADVMKGVVTVQDVLNGDLS